VPRATRAGHTLVLVGRFVSHLLNDDCLNRHCLPKRIAGRSPHSAQTRMVLEVRFRRAATSEVRRRRVAVRDTGVIETLSDMIGRSPKTGRPTCEGAVYHLVRSISNNLVSVWCATNHARVWCVLSITRVSLDRLLRGFPLGRLSSLGLGKHASRCYCLYFSELISGITPPGTSVRSSAQPQSTIVGLTDVS
jgi:hypothetical protein